MAKSDILVRWKADTAQYDANIAKAKRQLEGFKEANLTAGGAVKQMTAQLVGAASRMMSLTAAVGAVTSAIRYNVDTAMNFQRSMSVLSSLTGKVGDDLNQLKENAIELGGSTTLTASQVADAFRLIGSQQPQLLSSSEALKDVTKQAITLSEAAGIDLQTAAQTLSTSINQMGGNSGNAARYVNVLAAASQKGAGDIAWLGEAITKSATAAKAVGTDYEELVANLEQLAKAGFDASTAGTALRSIIMNLEKQSKNEYKPSVVGLTQAFENLGKANLTVTSYQKIAGKMFASQAMALANAAGEAKKMKEEITGTSTAADQAATNVDNLDGAIKSLSSAWEALNLHINSSNGMLTDVVRSLTSMIKWVDTLTVSTSSLSDKLASVSGLLWKMNSGPIGKVAALITGVASNYAPGAGGSGTAGGALGGGFFVPSTGDSGADPPPPDPPKPKKEDSGRQGFKNLSMMDARTGPTESLAELRTTLARFKTARDNATSTSALLDAQAGIERTQRKIGAQEVALRFGVSTDAWLEMEDSVKTSMAQLSDNLPPIEVKFTDAAPKRLVKIGQETMETWQAAANAVNGMGSALQALEDPGAKVAGMIAQAIANIALGFAQAAASPATGAAGVFGWIAAATAGTATMVSTIAAIKSATAGNYATGGIIPGNYHQDQLRASDYGISSGELILNRAQQGVLAAQMQGGGMSGMHLDTYISGEQLRIVLNRNSMRRGKGEYITSKQS